MQCSEMTKCMFIPYLLLRNRKFPIIIIKAGTKTSLTFPWQNIVTDVTLREMCAPVVCKMHA